jgi:uncharacterized protein (TIGR03083 family)
MIDSSPAARLLLVEAAALERVLRRAPAAAFALPTGRDGWSVRDVLAHCSTILGQVTSGDPPASGVELRRSWPLEKLLEELFSGYPAAAAVVAAAEGRLDGVALELWVHGGDVREALSEPDAFTSIGVEVALDLLVARSSSLPAVVADLPDRMLHLGRATSGKPARVVTDVETLVRLLTGRRPDRTRYHLEGVEAEALNLFR